MRSQRTDIKKTRTARQRLRLLKDIGKKALNSGVIKAIRGRDYEFVRALIDAGADVNVKDGDSSALSIAISNNDIEAAKILISAGADINRPSHAFTPLMEAVTYENAQILKLLAQAGARLDERFIIGGTTALIQAAKERQPDLVTVLLESGADPNVADDGGRTALDWARKTKNAQIIALLEAGQAKIGSGTSEDEILEAVGSGNLKNVKSCLAVGGNPNAADIPENTKRTALMVASSKGYVDVVKELLKAGVDPKGQDARRNTALGYAAEAGECTIMELLLKAGAEVDAPDRDGFTPLLAAVDAGKVDAARMLLEAGANMKLRTKYRDTVLELACSTGSVRLVNLLLEHGADPNQKACRGMTPLMHGAMLGKAKVVRRLLDVGAEVNAQDSNGKTALIYAVGGVAPLVPTIYLESSEAEMEEEEENSEQLKGCLEVISILVAAGANPDLKDNEGMTALMWSFSTASAKLLVEAGADLNATDEKGKTAADLAKARKHRALEKFLREYASKKRT